MYNCTECQKIFSTRDQLRAVTYFETVLANLNNDNDTDTNYAEIRTSNMTFDLIIFITTGLIEM